MKINRNAVLPVLGLIVLLGGYLAWREVGTTACLAPPHQLRGLPGPPR